MSFYFIYFQNKYKNTFFLLSTERHTKKIGLHTDWKKPFPIFTHFVSIHPRIFIFIFSHKNGNEITKHEKPSQNNKK
jgi:hypothetical protein